MPNIRNTEIDLGKIDKQKLVEDILLFMNELFGEAHLDWLQIHASAIADNLGFVNETNPFEFDWVGAWQEYTKIHHPFNDADYEILTPDWNNT